MDKTENLRLDYQTGKKISDGRTLASDCDGSLVTTDAQVAEFPYLPAFMACPLCCVNRVYLSDRELADYYVGSRRGLTAK